MTIQDDALEVLVPGQLALDLAPGGRWNADPRQLIYQGRALGQIAFGRQGNWWEVWGKGWASFTSAGLHWRAEQVGRALTLDDLLARIVDEAGQQVGALVSGARHGALGSALALEYRSSVYALERLSPSEGAFNDLRDQHGATLFSIDYPVEHSIADKVSIQQPVELGLLVAALLAAHALRR